MINFNKNYEFLIKPTFLKISVNSAFLNFTASSMLAKRPAFFDVFFMFNTFSISL